MVKLLDKLIWHLKAFDVIWYASVPMYFSCQSNILIWGLMVLSGEGADEVLEVICILAYYRFQKKL
jgi:asparagine synthetase B (glutamine-hydrolysing)